MNDTVVTTEWLAGHLGDPDVRIVDGTWHMPQLGRDARREFAEAHIPGAVFFDVDAIADADTTLPHMLPSPEKFAREVGALGIGDGDQVVVEPAVRVAQTLGRLPEIEELSVRAVLLARLDAEFHAPLSGSGT